MRLADGSSQVILLAGTEGHALAYDPQWAALTVSAAGTLELQDNVPVLRTDKLEVTETTGVSSNPHSNFKYSTTPAQGE